MPTTVAAGCGRMREALTIETNAPPVLTVTSLVRAGSTATAVTAIPHDYQTNDYVFLTGIVESSSDIIRPKIIVTNLTTFTFTVPGGKPIAASGEMTTMYAGDPQTGRRDYWRPIMRIRAAIDPLRTSERLERGALRSSIDYRFRVYRRDEITATMRARWTPSTGGSEQLLMLTGKPIPVGDGRRYMDLEVTTAPA